MSGGCLLILTLVDLLSNRQPGIPRRTRTSKGRRTWTMSREEPEGRSLCSCASMYFHIQRPLNSSFLHDVWVLYAIKPSDMSCRGEWCNQHETHQIPSGKQTWLAGKWTIYRWFSLIFLLKPPFSSGIFQPTMFDPEGPTVEELEQRLVELTRMLASARLHSKARLEQVRGPGSSVKRGTSRWQGCWCQQVFLILSGKD